MQLHLVWHHRSRKSSLHPISVCLLVLMKIKLKVCSRLDLNGFQHSRSFADEKQHSHQCFLHYLDGKSEGLKKKKVIVSIFELEGKQL